MLDCDELDENYGSITDDLDCDGIVNIDDSDADGDGISAEEDCDDLDTSISFYGSEECPEKSCWHILQKNKSHLPNLQF